MMELSQLQKGRYQERADVSTRFNMQASEGSKAVRAERQFEMLDGKLLLGCSAMGSSPYRKASSSSIEWGIFFEKVGVC